MEHIQPNLKCQKLYSVKADDETEPNNCRPITLLFNFNRIFGKKLIQYGFRGGHSNQHTIIGVGQHYL